MLWMYTAPGACLLNAPGAVCISNVVLEHMVQEHMVLDKLGQNLQKANRNP